EQRRQNRDGSQHREEPLQLWYFKLGSFLYDMAQFGPRRVVPDNCCMNHARHRAGRARGFVKCFSEIAPTNEVRQSLQELAHMNRGTVQVKEAFGKDSNGDDATAQNWPHQ